MHVSDRVSQVPSDVIVSYRTKGMISNLAVDGIDNGWGPQSGSQRGPAVILEIGARRRKRKECQPTKRLGLEVSEEVKERQEEESPRGARRALTSSSSESSSQEREEDEEEEGEEGRAKNKEAKWKPKILVTVRITQADEEKRALRAAYERSHLQLKVPRELQEAAPIGSDEPRLATPRRRTSRAAPCERPEPKEEPVETAPEADVVEAQVVQTP